MPPITELKKENGMVTSRNETIRLVRFSKFPGDAKSRTFFESLCEKVRDIAREKNTPLADYDIKLCAKTAFNYSDKPGVVEDAINSIPAFYDSIALMACKKLPLDLELHEVMQSKNPDKYGKLEDAKKDSLVSIAKYAPFLAEKWGASGEAGRCAALSFLAGEPDMLDTWDKVEQAIVIWNRPRNELDYEMEKNGCSEELLDFYARKMEFSSSRLENYEFWRKESGIFERFCISWSKSDIDTIKQGEMKIKGEFNLPGEFNNNAYSGALRVIATEDGKYGKSGEDEKRIEYLDAFYAILCGAGIQDAVKFAGQMDFDCPERREVGATLKLMHCLRQYNWAYMKSDYEAMRKLRREIMPYWNWHAKKLSIENPHLGTSDIREGVETAILFDADNNLLSAMSKVRNKMNETGDGRMVTLPKMARALKLDDENLKGFGRAICFNALEQLSTYEFENMMEKFGISPANKIVGRKAMERKKQRERKAEIEKQIGQVKEKYGLDDNDKKFLLRAITDLEAKAPQRRSRGREHISLNEFIDELKKKHTKDKRRVERVGENSDAPRVSSTERLELSYFGLGNGSHRGKHEFGKQIAYAMAVFDIAGAESFKKLMEKLGVEEPSRLLSRTRLLENEHLDIECAKAFFGLGENHVKILQEVKEQMESQSAERKRRAASHSVFNPFLQSVHPEDVEKKKESLTHFILSLQDKDARGRNYRTLVMGRINRKNCSAYNEINGILKPDICDFGPERRNNRHERKMAWNEQKSNPHSANDFKHLIGERLTDKSKANLKDMGFDL